MVQWLLDEHKREADHLLETNNNSVLLQGDNGYKLRNIGFGWYIVNPEGWAVINHESSEKYLTLAVGGCLPIVMDRADGMRVFLHETESLDHVTTHPAESAIAHYHQFQMNRNFPPIVSASVFGLIETEREARAIQRIRDLFAISPSAVETRHFELPTKHRNGIGLIAYEAMVVNGYITFYRTGESSHGTILKLPGRTLHQLVTLQLRAHLKPHLELKPMDTLVYHDDGNTW